MIQNSKSLTLDGVSKCFGSVQAVKPLSLRVEAGELLALLGPSGCGKTTTLRMIAGFEYPDAGRVLIGDRDVVRLPPNKRDLGMVFQSYSLFPHMTVGENVAFGLKMRKVGVSERAERARKLLQMVRLSGYEDRLISQLSGGQQQRVALARAMATNPAVLLLDEPLGALDKNLREGMQFELKSLQRNLGITSVMVTHDQEEAITMSDKVAVMNEGSIIQMGTPNDVYKFPVNRFVSEFLGTSNLFRALVDEIDAVGAYSVRYLELDNVVGVAHSKVHGFEPHQEVLVAIRPECIAVVGEELGVVRAKVTAAVFRGSHYAFSLSLPRRESPIFAYKCDLDVPPKPGDTVGLRWANDSVVVLPSVE